jgi:signal peptidase II
MALAMNLLGGGRLTRHYVWALPLSAAIIAIDQWTKWVVLGVPELNALACRENDRCGKIEFSPIFDFSMMWNRGISFGAFQAEGLARWALFAVTAGIAIGFGFWLVKASRRMTAASLAMVIGGAIGNMIDRALHGAVVDFLDFGDVLFPWVFNVADASISVGAVLLLLDQVLASRKKAG